MKPSEQNVDIARRIFSALSSGDVAPISPYLQEKSVFQFRGANALAGRHQGPESIAALLKRFAALTTEREGKLVLEQVITGDGHAMAHFRMTATRGGQTFNAMGCQVARLHDGRISEVWYTFGDPYGFDTCYA